jgi:predicted nucleotidyltransferase
VSHAQAIKALCRRHGLAELYVFGSRCAEVAARVRSDAGPPKSAPTGSPEADVDVGVRPPPGRRLSAEELVTIAGELEVMLAVPRVDVVLLSTAPPYLALEAVRGELLFCADGHAQAEFELYVLRRAGDLAPFQRARHEMVLSGGENP